MKQETVLVTGAGGFIGSHVTEALTQLGRRVVGVDRIPKGNHTAAQWIQADLLDPSQTFDFVKSCRPDRLIHLAWNVDHTTYWHDAANVSWLKASVSLLQACIQNGCRRIVTAGTCAEYLPTDRPIEEDTAAVSTETLYAACKYSLYAIGRALCKAGGVPFAHGRVFYLYGPGEKPSRIFPYVINQLLRNEPALVSGGTQARDYLHVVDVANAFALLALSDDALGAVNISSGGGVPLKTCFEAIRTATGAPSSLLRLGAIPAKDDVPLIAGDNTKLRAVGWEQRFSLEAGIDDAVDWWRKRMEASEP